MTESSERDHLPGGHRARQRATSRATLGPHETALFEQHLNFCDGCDWYVDQMRTTIAAVGRIEPADVPPALRDGLLAAFRDRERS